MRVVTIARKPCASNSTTANVVEHEAGALNIEASRIETTDDLNGGAYAKDGKERHDGYDNWRYKREGGAGDFEQPAGRWPSNVILVGDEVVVAMGEQSGESQSRVGKPRGSKEPGQGWGMTATGAEYDDTGTAARFFKKVKP